MPGWIKIYRDIVTKDIYLQPPLYLRVFERMVMEANHSCKIIPFGKGERLVRRGERVTSIRQIAEWVGWYERGILRNPNPKTIREILKYLEEKEIIEILNLSDKGNRQETHYKVVNYWRYQSCEIEKVTADGQVSTQSADTNNNVKNVKNDKNIKKEYAQFVKMTEEEYRKLITDFGQAKINEMIEDLNNWKGGKGKKTKSDCLTIRAWIRREQKQGGANKNGQTSEHPEIDMAGKYRPFVSD